MKNEVMPHRERIVELLAESLRKQDQMVEQMTAMNYRLDKHEDILLKVVTSLDKLTDVVLLGNERLANIERKLDDLADLRDRIKRIERHVGLD